MTSHVPALNEKALEAAFRFAETTDADWISLRPNMVEGTIRAYIAALPAVSEPTDQQVEAFGAEFWGAYWIGAEEDKAQVRAALRAALVEPLYHASALAALQSRVTELEGELAALKAALKPLSERAAKWKHNTDSARISVPLREIRAALASHDHSEMRHNAPCVQQDGGKP